jgi:hypothetical protein
MFAVKEPLTAEDAENAEEEYLLCGLCALRGEKLL